MTKIKKDGSASPELVCAVCGDKAQGRHYGVSACNGCRGFFRRNAWKQMSFVCRFIGKCRIGKADRNSCRFCRLKACLAAGMNPRAVQSDLPRDLTEEEAEEESVSSIDCSTQTTLSNLELLLRKLERIFTRVDTVPIERAGTSSVTYPFEVAFRQPQLIHERTKIDISANHEATINEIAASFQRTFVLFSDLLQTNEYFVSFSAENQIKIAKQRFAHFHFWILCCWSAWSNCDGICFNNGSFHPYSKTRQCLPENLDVTQLSVDTVSSILKEVNVTKDEMMIGTLFAVFFECPLEYVSDSEVTSTFGTAADTYLQFLMDCSPIHEDEHKNAIRLARICTALANITAIVHSSTHNFECEEILKMIDSPDTYWVDEKTGTITVTLPSLSTTPS